MGSGGSGGRASAGKAGSDDVGDADALVATVAGTGAVAVTNGTLSAFTGCAMTESQKAIVTAIGAGLDTIPAITREDLLAMRKRLMARGNLKIAVVGAIDAAKSGVNAVHVVDGRVPHAMLLEILTDQAYGTMIRSH